MNLYNMQKCLPDGMFNRAKKPNFDVVVCVCWKEVKKVSWGGKGGGVDYFVPAILLKSHANHLYGSQGRL